MGPTIANNIIRLFATGILPIFRHENTSIPVPATTAVPSNNTDIGLTVTQLISKYGYPVEEHSIETSDGYILGVQRIPNSKNNPTGNDTIRPVAFLMAGLLCSAADWVIAGPDKGLGYLLADQGYDVWLGNGRGTTHSRKHVKYDPDKNSDFWMFSWHEIGVYDLPAMIDYILETTKNQQLYYVGHSQGTTAFFVMTSKLPKYNTKIKVMAALAPVAFMQNVKNPLVQTLAPFQQEILLITDRLGRYEVLPDTPLMTAIGDVLCSERTDTKDVCSNILFLIAGYDSKQLNETLVPAILSNLPAGASTRQLAHFAQSVNTGKFREFDHSFRGNWKKYSRIIPPAYDLNQITSKIGMFYSENDLLTAPKDVKLLSKRLRNVVKMYEVPLKEFNHLDFLYAKNVVELVYIPVINFFKLFRK